MEISFLFKIAGIGIVVVIMQQILSKSGREEYATLTVLTGIIVIVIMLIPHITSLINDLNSFFSI